ncbi:hypothetical protein N0V90_002003 [Kalmusia sp. IMI 367209]|nr:hypothetical protein N0V90_002003 [Kalmusia sp. IMI 367209]
MINIPTFESTNLTTMWNPVNSSGAQRIDGYGESPVWITDDGMFTFDLSVSSVSGTFQGLASASSNATETGGLRNKFDSSGYRFDGRSYGVGASAGLITVPDTVVPNWYSYHEIGLKTKATCTRNKTAAYNIGYIFSNDTQFRHEFTANGTFANGVPVPDHYPLLAPQRQDIFIWSVGHAGPNAIAANKTLIALGSDATTKTDDWDFHQFDKVQCEVTFQATNFSVWVNTTSKIVKATEVSQVPNPNYANAVLQRLDDPFSRYSGNDRIVYGSQLGHSIVLNVNQLRLLTNDTSDKTLFQGVQDYIESLFDNGVGMLSATRLIGTNKTISVEATVGLPAVTYGKPAFVYALLCINFFMLLMFLAEAIRTRLWTDMARLQLSDVGDVILAASEGGNTIASRARNTAQKEIGDIKVQLVRIAGSDREAIVLPKAVSNVADNLNYGSSGDAFQLQEDFKGQDQTV